MFLPYKCDRSTQQPWEYMPAAAGNYKAGQLLTVASGKVSALSAASKTTPPYLCMADITAAAGQIIPVQRVTDDVIFETQLSAEAASAAVGTKLEVSADGLSADAAAAGTFEITWLDGTAAGSTVLGRFV